MFINIINNQNNMYHLRRYANKPDEDSMKLLKHHWILTHVNPDEGVLLCEQSYRTNKTLLSFRAVDVDSTIYLENYDNEPVVFYSYDKKTWNNWKDEDYQELQIPAGEKLYMYGENPNGFSKSEMEYSNFVMDGKISASGNIQSLLSKDCKNIMTPYCFTYLFSGCECLTNAPELPSTNLKTYCYAGMFTSCSSLTRAPKLPATNPKSFCYAGMFAGCESLTIVPELPATNLAAGCYSEMFLGCESIQHGPELPATNLTESCYQGMFSGCVGLTAAPELPATTLTQYCYDHMFSDCVNLNRVSVNFTSWNGGTNGWLRNVPNSGTFIKPEDLEVVLGDSWIPGEWTYNTSVIPTVISGIKWSWTIIDK